MSCVICNDAGGLAGPCRSCGKDWFDNSEEQPCNQDVTIFDPTNVEELVLNRRQAEKKVWADEVLDRAINVTVCGNFPCDNKWRKIVFSDTRRIIYKCLECGCICDDDKAKAVINRTLIQP
jgi:hypothetical protein